MSSITKVAFITWDGPESNYIESLFLPIFVELKKYNYHFHIIQFTWASKATIKKRKKEINSSGFDYLPISVCTFPLENICKFLSLFINVKKVQNYINSNDIDLVMPRSTMPAILVNKLKLTKAQIIFDADGLPIEERVDFAGLKVNSLQYKMYKKAEFDIINKSARVLVRTNKAIEHFIKLGFKKSLFSLVFNGKDENIFKIYDDNLSKTKIGINNDTKLFLYCGSVGPQYRLNLMFKIFNHYLESNPNSHFIFLTGSKKAVTPFLNLKNKDKITIKQVENSLIPLYINAADICFGLREFSYSMQGVSPIKLGEYLLCGTPFIATKNIGDSSEFLPNVEGIHLIDNNNFEIDEVVFFINNVKKTEVSENLRKIGIKNYSLSLAAKSYQESICQPK